VIVPVGTSIEDLVAFCGGWACEAHKVVYGGPMMGTSVTSTASPVLKTTNAVLTFDEKEAVIPDPTPCIRCGACTNHCPMGINPAEIARAYKRGDMVALDELAVDLCMECGCCSYICPAHRPLVQTNKLSKIALKNERAKEAKES
jgi:electron transport complex protein RnfC